MELYLFCLLANEDFYFSFSGTVSYFNHSLNAEIAFPFFYASDSLYKNYGNEERFTLLTLDAHYRHFLGGTVNGFYISGFGRFLRLRGEVDNWQWMVDGNEGFRGATENKFGIGAGIGYRSFSQNGIYWGTSLSLGK